MVRARPQREQREQQLVGGSRGAFAAPGRTADGMGPSKPSWELASEMTWRSEVKRATSGQNLGDRRSEAAVQILVGGQRQANCHASRRGPLRGLLVRKLIKYSLPLCQQRDDMWAASRLGDQRKAALQMSIS